jgi:hypothetical protein
VTTDTIPQAARRTLRALAAPFRFRVVRDAEGWPIIPGRAGRIEDHDGCELAVWTDRRRLFRQLWTIPGVRRWQTGDQEMRALFPPEALEPVAGLIRARRRRQANAGSFPTPGIAPLPGRQIDSNALDDQADGVDGENAAPGRQETPEPTSPPWLWATDGTAGRHAHRPPTGCRAAAEVEADREALMVALAGRGLAPEAGAG